MSIPIIDLFAGPGGLGEGFSSFETADGQAPFRIRVSIEKDAHAHQTLELRSFFRQFPRGQVPEDYYNYLRGSMTREQLLEEHPAAAAAAREEAKCAELGAENDPIIFKYIEDALKDCKEWVLIGGPPCQLYSVIGRARLSNMEREEFEGDKRHVLYKEYLKIIAKFLPSVFVMENVRGILSSKLDNKLIIHNILSDLKYPRRVVYEEPGDEQEYTIYSLAVQKKSPEMLQPVDYLIKAEDYGIPQTRHRIILLGVRKDLHAVPGILEEEARVTVRQVLSDLPPIRSNLSKEPDSMEAWKTVLCSVLTQDWFHSAPLPDLFEEDPLRAKIREALAAVPEVLYSGETFHAWDALPEKLAWWFRDERLGGVCNHVARGHIRNDLLRYLYIACYAQAKGKSPSMCDLPEELLPAHKNVAEAIKNKTFDDRFRVQLADSPATTVTAHISKDGHYNVHYEPWQCRSLTVREAARLQTFPDNYFFEGPRTEQYRQVGNAVPPLLARKIAGVVFQLMQTPPKETPLPV